MRVENTFCEECGVSHFVQIMQRDTRGMIIKTKCHGKDFLPIQSNSAIGQGSHVIRHRLRGYDVIKKYKSEPRKKMATTFKKEYKIPQPVPAVNRVCVAEISVFTHGQFLTIKVFEDATPEKFYEFFYEAGNTPKMVKPRNLGKEKPVHISDIQRVFKIDGKVNPIFHNRQKYEKLLTVDPESMAVILEKNMAVSSGHR